MCSGIATPARSYRSNKNSLRYVVQHLDYFSEVLREGEKSDPNHAVFNWINAKEMEFGFARKELRKVLPDERIGTPVLVT